LVDADGIDSKDYVLVWSSNLKQGELKVPLRGAAVSAVTDSELAPSVGIIPPFV